MQQAIEPVEQSMAKGTADEQHAADSRVDKRMRDDFACHMQPHTLQTAC